jgi:hypothetical protein
MALMARQGKAGVAAGAACWCILWLHSMQSWLVQCGGGLWVNAAQLGLGRGSRREPCDHSVSSDFVQHSCAEHSVRSC